MRRNKEPYQYYPIRDFDVLSFIEEAGETTTRSIRDALGLSYTRTIYIVNNLEEHGLIKINGHRTSYIGGAPGKVIEITEKGKRVLEIYKEIVERYDKIKEIVAGDDGV